MIGWRVAAGGVLAALAVAVAALVPGGAVVRVVLAAPVMLVACGLLLVARRHGATAGDVSPGHVGDRRERRVDRDTAVALRRVADTILSTRDEEMAFAALADQLEPLVGYDAFVIHKADRRAREVRAVFARGPHAEEVMAHRLELGEGLVGWAIVHDEAILADDVAGDPRAVFVPGTAKGSQASLFVPLRVDNEVAGVLELDRLTGTTFSSHELELVEPFADLAAIAIGNASLFEKSRRPAVSDALTGLHDHGHFRETLDREVKRCERYGETFSLLMIDLDDFARVNDRYGHPRGDKVLQRVAAVLTETARESDYTARCGGEEFVVLLPQTPSDDGCALAERVCEGVRGIRVTQGDDFRISASVGVADFPGCGLDARTILAAAETALLWAKRGDSGPVQYYRDVRETAVLPPKERVEEESWRADLDAMAAAVDERTAFRERHSEAVAGMVRELAGVAGCSAEEQAVCEIGARLHDVGKIGLAADILAKGGSLGSAEVEEVRRHVRVGADSLANAGAPEELQRIVLHHHERWDGEGYPDGLRGDEIPLGARLVAVCDAFQAMLCDRPYRDARALAEARDEIRRLSGRQFDPRLVALFLDACAASGADPGGERAAGAGLDAE
jgi:diguanylate cyclase (GGDEF)-like protein